MGSLIKTLKALAWLALLAALAACGSSNNSSNTTIRFVNATRTTALSVTLNGTAEFSNVAPQSGTSYSTVGTGTYTVTVASPSASLSSSTQSIGLAASQSYTLLAYDRDGAIFVAAITEDQTVPATGYGTLGGINLSPDSGPLDVYVVAPGTTTFTGLTPTFPNLQGGTSTAFATLVDANYDFVATASGNPLDIRGKVSAVAVSNGKNLTLAFTSTAGGALVDGVLLTQGSSVTFSPTTNARVRVVSALPTSGSFLVAATVGGTALPSVFAPNAGSYNVVSGGTSTYSVSVSGTAVASLPSATFATGGDFTILVFGSATAPSVSVLTDNNQTPVAGNVNLRLVNAATAANVTGGLTMYDNGVQVASSVAYGAASGYFGVTVSGSTPLQLIVPSLAPVTQLVSLATPGAVYTVFVLDNASPPPPFTPYLIRDR